MYPTWIKKDAKTWVSEEQVNGVPDFIITYEGIADYRLKVRTSAMALRFHSRIEAKDYASQAFRAQERKGG